ncbi:MAG: DUF6164 family protein [Gammaproteobacteria bacterium]|nr:DUF6164 family protein [Gammaproteobacteria bacterium]MDD9958701.1 DUF6164 family protein [Gammaproteobacteria bacterium]
MSKLLFKMRYVPEDEAQEVRDLLDENGIEYFETHAGNWGISVPAIWAKRNDQFTQARELIDEYQKQRIERVREEFEISRQRGETKTMWHSFLEEPLRFMVYMGLVIAVLYFSLQFFLSF